jgi:manganese efflux pump family protein
MSVSVILLAFALAADAFAVALGQGAEAPVHPWRAAFVVGTAFGAAQAIAPLIGWSLGVAFADTIESYDHWIAFGMLSLIGLAMIRKGARADPRPEAGERGGEPTARGWTLFTLAVATSIDAAGAGITLPSLGVPVLVGITVIGAVTFVLSVTGVLLGRIGSRILGSNAEIVGGLILIAIGAKILVDHHAFG